MDEKIENHLHYLLWFKKAEWTSLEAILLQLGFDPDYAPPEILSCFWGPPNWPGWWEMPPIPKDVTDFASSLDDSTTTFLQLYALAKIALGSGKIQNSMPPESWMVWFINQGLSIDTDLWKATTSHYPDFPFEPSRKTGDGRMDAFRKKGNWLNENNPGRPSIEQNQSTYGEKMVNEIKKVFVIMAMGDKLLDKIFNDIFIIVFKEIDPKIKVDKADIDEQGGILKKEIVDFIINSDLILADLTYARPNCYLEVGIAMGLNLAQGYEKYPNIILSVREDHNSDSKNFNPENFKVHFDLSGYPIIFWDQNNLAKLKLDLHEKVNHRIKQIKNRPKLPSFTPPKNDPKVERLQQVLREAKPIKITPFIPMEYANSEFRIEKITEGGDIEFQKMDSQHNILIPISKIKEVIRNINQPSTIEISGRIQRVSIINSWRYCAEDPKDEFGISKPATDLARIRSKLREKEIRFRYCSLNELMGSRMAETWQVFYDEDGRYIRMPERPFDRILCIPRPKIMI